MSNKSITKEQKSFLDSLICERFSTKDINYVLIRDRFKNHRNTNLIEHILNEGYESEKKRITAFYVIKTTDDNPLLFFSLKCASLFKNYDDDDKKRFDDTKQLAQQLNNGSNTYENSLEEFKLKWDFDIGDVYYEIDKVNCKMSLYEDEKNKEKNKNIHYAETVFSAINMEHICVNDEMKEEWKNKMNNHHNMGETLFWYFVVDKILRIREEIGCEYLHIFAADKTEDRSLIKYYESQFKFEIKDEIGTNKPQYDYGCVFMAQSIDKLKLERQNFLDNFNDFDKNFV